MREFLRKVGRILRWPERFVGLGSDAYTIWSLREIIKQTVLSIWGAVALALSLIASAALGLWTSMSGLSRIFVVIIAIGALLLVFTLLVVAFRLVQAWRAGRKAEQQARRVAPEPRTVNPDANLQAEPSSDVSANEWWRERIEKWNSVIPEYDLDDTDDRQRFLRTDTYSQMRQHLRPEVVEMFEAQRRFHVGNEARGDAAYRYTLLDEVDRIERERVFNAPEPIRKQATPGELKALCFHLADELDDEHRSYLNSEQMVMLWEQELKGQAVSESEIDQKAESARDEHLAETLNRYNKHLKGRLLNLHDALGPWFGAIDRSRFENLSDPHYMSNFAKRLREVGGKLPDS